MNLAILLNGSCFREQCFLNNVCDSVMIGDELSDLVVTLEDNTLTIFLQISAMNVVALQNGSCFRWQYSLDRVAFVLTYQWFYWMAATPNYNALLIVVGLIMNLVIHLNGRCFRLQYSFSHSTMISDEFSDFCWMVLHQMSILTWQCGSCFNLQLILLNGSCFSLQYSLDSVSLALTYKEFCWISVALD
jgi:hypothetical protein